MKAWADSLGSVNYPLLSDFWPHGSVSKAYGVLRPEGYTERAIFVIDKYGIIRYIDIHNFDEQPDNEELFKVLNEIDPQAAQKAPNETTHTPVSSSRGASITLYCTSWCPDCRRARLWLKARNLDFVDIDIDANPAASDQVKKWNDGKRITPTFDIDGVIIANFDEKAILKALQSRMKS